MHEYTHVNTHTASAFCAASSNFATDKQWGLCTCNMTQPGPVDFALTFNLVFRLRPAETMAFVYYPNLALLPSKDGGLFPMSGTSESPSTLRIRGSNFSNTGQTLRCMFADDFGINATTLATTISDTLLTCQVCLAFGTLLHFSSCFPRRPFLALPYLSPGPQYSVLLIVRLWWSITLRVCSSDSRKDG